MPRTESANLTTIFNSHQRIDTLDLYLADGTRKRLSRGAATRDGFTYQDYIRGVGDFVKTAKEVNRLRIECQNINSELGLVVASDLRLLDFAVCEYGRIYKSNTNTALVEDYPQMFRAVLANASITETRTSFDLITDIESLNNVVAGRSLSPKNPWAYKNGRECTSLSAELTCTKTRLACAKRLKQWEFGGWEFFDDPADYSPGLGGNLGGGIGGGIGQSGGVPCFTLDTPIWTPAGSVPIGSFPVGVAANPIKIYSFNPATDEVEEDFIAEVFEHDVTGYFELEFEHGTIKVTGEHPLYTGANRFRPVEEFPLGGTAQFHPGASWKNSRLTAMRWHSGATVKVRNVHVKKNQTYFANGCGVHNICPYYQPYIN